mgnify:FL=1
MEILHFLSSKSAAYKQERLQIESGLWWRAYGTLIYDLNPCLIYLMVIADFSNYYTEPDLGLAPKSLATS